MNWLLSNRKTKEGLIHVECMGENARLTLRLCPPNSHHRMRYRYVHTYTMETLRSAWPSYLICTVDYHAKLHKINTHKIWRHTQTHT